MQKDTEKAVLVVLITFPILYGNCKIVTKLLTSSRGLLIPSVTCESYTAPSGLSLATPVFTRILWQGHFVEEPVELSNQIQPAPNGRANPATWVAFWELHGFTEGICGFQEAWLMFLHCKNKSFIILISYLLSYFYVELSCILDRALNYIQRIFLCIISLIHLK